MLLTESGCITHLNVLVLGPPHTGKTTLCHTLLRGAVLDSSKNILGSTNATAQQQQQLPQTKSLYLGPYVPTIEESTTFQFIVNPSTGVQDSHQTDPTATSPQSTATPRRITITLMDLGGHPLYYALWPSAIAAADAFMLVYDVGDRQSLQSLWKYYRLIVETKSATLSMARPDEIPMLLVGSMVDTVTSNKMLSAPTTTRTTASASIESTPHAIPRTGGYGGHTTSTPLSTAKRPRQISSQMGQMFADILHIPHDETTSKAPQSITYCFRKLISEAQNKAAGMMLAAQTMNADTVAGLGSYPDPIMNSGPMSNTHGHNNSNSSNNNNSINSNGSTNAIGRSDGAGGVEWATRFRSEHQHMQRVQRGNGGGGGASNGSDATVHLASHTHNNSHHGVNRSNTLSVSTTTTNTNAQSDYASHNGVGSRSSNRSSSGSSVQSNDSVFVTASAGAASATQSLGSSLLPSSSSLSSSSSTNSSTTAAPSTTATPATTTRFSFASKLTFRSSVERVKGAVDRMSNTRKSAAAAAAASSSHGRKRSGGGSPSDSIAKPSPPALSITPLQSSNSSSGVLNRLPMQAGTTQSGWVKSPHSASPAYQHNTSLSDDSITTLYSPGYAYGSYPSDISYSNPVTVDIQKQQQEQHTLYPHKSNPHLTVSTHISGRQGDKETLHATATNTPTTSIYSPTSSYAADTSVSSTPGQNDERMDSLSLLSPVSVTADDRLLPSVIGSIRHRRDIAYRILVQMRAEEAREQSQLKQQQLQQLQHYLKLSKSPQQPPILYTESTLPQSATVSARQSTLSMDTLSGSSFSSEGGNTSTGGLIRPGYDARPVVRRMASMVHSRSALTNSGVHVILPERNISLSSLPVMSMSPGSIDHDESDTLFKKRSVNFGSEQDDMHDVTTLVGYNDVMGSAGDSEVKSGHVRVATDPDLLAKRYISALKGPHMTGGRPIQRPLVAGLSLQKSDLSMARQRIQGLLDELELVDFKDVDMGDQPLQQEISHSETSKAISDETNRLHRVKSEGVRESEVICKVDPNGSDLLQCATAESLSASHTTDRTYIGDDSAVVSASAMGDRDVLISHQKNNQPMRKNSEPQQVLEDVANGGKIISTSGEKDRPVSIARSRNLPSESHTRMLSEFLIELEAEHSPLISSALF
ncbi:hypothetical protein BASA50_006939 [Batrachochytrium salamandrivorans]|uniref:G domain-containing protein n=1 Tax=Batrachochytrium salamandrivorans TaxID=1357716 RepID=A0ABQ8FBP9_9FUNG|nr:hypothetical protein BASA50_006939 [Batrachochytrium salamandrivorans]